MFSEFMIELLELGIVEDLFDLRGEVREFEEGNIFGGEIVMVARDEVESEWDFVGRNNFGEGGSKLCTGAKY